MDAFRYGLTVALVCTLPPFLLYWPVVHGLIGFWRRRGPKLTFALLLGGTLAAVAALYCAREHLVIGDYGTHFPVVAAGVLMLVLAGWLRVQIGRELSTMTLAGLPEIAPKSHPQPLIRTGLYARLRHPRYVQFFAALGGWALIANYLSAYAVWLSWIPGVYVLVLFEERELRERFGEAYEQYRREVPRFVPRLSRSRR